MKEERGEALRLLYQIKMALEKVYPPTDIAVLRKSKLVHNFSFYLNMIIYYKYLLNIFEFISSFFICLFHLNNIAGKMGDNQPALKIAHSKEKYD